MKNLIYCVLLILTSLNIKAQVTTPVESPSASFTQKFGLTEIKMEYSRPSVKNRKIFGNVVILDKIWRIGANGSTKFTTTDSITVAGKGLSKGTYIMPVDPDDYILPNTLKQQLDKAFEKDLDVLYLGFDILNENGKLIWKTDYKLQEEKLFSGVEAYFASRGENVMDPDRSVAILYKRSVLQKFGINYPKT